MVIYGVEFEWDLSKELTNLKKHKVSFPESVETFFDPSGIQLTDQKHSGSEPRFYWVGKSEQGRVLTTWFTRRGDKVRIIGSAEWRRFRRLYETTQVK